jgi:hypothetical protein
MPYVYLDPPPGVHRNGTEYESVGRWYETYLARWHDRVLQPIGGWTRLQDSSGDVDLTGSCLGMHAWLDISDTAYLVMGTETKAYAFSEGTLTDITPAAGFTTGNADATIASVYGAGLYGAGNYGGGGATAGTVVEANTSQFDNFGQIPIGWFYADQNIWDWDLNVANNFALVTNAPTQVLGGIVVTPERFLVALGASNDPQLVMWSDEEDRTVWTPGASNKAGDKKIASRGSLIAGRRGNGETVLWTTTDVWSMQFVGGDAVYRIQKRGDNCGAISRRAIGSASGRHFWMSKRSFYMYDGRPVEIPCEVSDYVFSSINRTQSSKIHCVPRAEFGEVEWFYCSQGSSEIDRSVAYNYVDNHWRIDSGVSRSAGVDQGVYQYPIMGDYNGVIYEHETGDSYLDLDDATALTPYAETGIFELGAGDHRMMIHQVIPDENTLGDVSATLYARDYPTDTERNSGALTLANPTSTRLSGRQAKMRVTQVSSGWRVGRVRLGVRQSSMR